MYSYRLQLMLTGQSESVDLSCTVATDVAITKHI